MHNKDIAYSHNLSQYKYLLNLWIRKWRIYYSLDFSSPNSSKFDNFVTKTIAPQVLWNLLNFSVKIIANDLTTVQNIFFSHRHHSHFDKLKFQFDCWNVVRYWQKKSLTVFHLKYFKRLLRSYDASVNFYFAVRFRLFLVSMAQSLFAITIVV